MLGVGGGLDLTRRLPAVEHGQAQIHQDHVGPLSPLRSTSPHTPPAREPHIAKRQTPRRHGPFRTGTPATALPRRKALPKSPASAASSSSTGVVIDPRRLQALGIPLAKIREALRTSNMWADGRSSLQKPRSRYVDAGYIKSLSDLEQIALITDRGA